MSYIQAAFEQHIADAEKCAEGIVYVVLEESIPYYGGPEEGGWWGRDTVVRAYKAYPHRKLAQAALAAVKALAGQMQEESRKSHGDHCLRQMDWLEARGLDADYLPEDDGPSDFFVSLTRTIPENTFGCRHYE